MNIAASGCRQSPDSPDPLSLYNHSTPTPRNLTQPTPTQPAPSQPTPHHTVQFTINTPSDLPLIQTLSDFLWGFVIVSL